MTRKTIVTLALLLVMLVSLFGTAAAQSGTDPEATPTPTVAPTTEPTEPAVQPGAKFFTHPVVKLLSAYFDQNTGEDDTPQDPTDPSITPTPDPNDSGLGPVGEAIAAYHEQGVGFGVLVKVYAMVKASEEACAAQDPGTNTDGSAPADGGTTCTPLTADQLITEIKGGAGMGTLFKEYGKPALLGVGHVRKALKHQEAQPTEDIQPTEDGQPTPAANDKPGKGHKNNPNKGGKQ